MIEGSEFGPVPLTNGSGSRWPENIGIQWIRIRYTALLDPDPFAMKLNKISFLFTVLLAITFHKCSLFSIYSFLIKR
jgi:hypothetical protein